MTGITVGSVGYMAPEQITGRAGTAADIFTWAVTVAYAASGQSPFGSGTSESMLYRIVHEAPDITAVPPRLRPLVEAALAKDPQARPTAPQLLAELTHGSAAPTGAHPRALDNATQTILAQNWHPTGGTRPPGGTSSRAYSPPTGGAPYRNGNPPRRRRALLPIVLALAFVLAAGGTALGLALAGRHDTNQNVGPSASGATSAGTPTQPGQIITSSAASTAPASIPVSTVPVSTPASTPPSTPVSTPASSPAALPVLTAGSYTGMKPTEIAFSGDATNVVTKISWTSWTATGASGTGTSDIDSCNPNCAQAPPSLVPTTITLTDPVDGKFTKMIEARNGSSATYTYPSNWPEGAS
jgi:serine/threonine protein kinase